MIEELLKRVIEAKVEKNRREFALREKEIEEYYRYKENNPKDRSAMDKVVAKLKLEDENWKELEEEYWKWKTKYDTLKVILSAVMLFLKRDDFGRDEINEFISELLTHTDPYFIAN